MTSRGISRGSAEHPSVAEPLDEASEGATSEAFAHAFTPSAPLVEGGAAVKPEALPELLIERVELDPVATAGAHALAGADAAEATARIGQVTVRSAVVLSVEGRRAMLWLRGEPAAVEASVASEVDPALVEEARAEGGTVLVELTPGAASLIVGVLQTQRPRVVAQRAGRICLEADEEIVLRAGATSVRLTAGGEVAIEGGQEVLVRSGAAAVRLRGEDGIEILAGRISASARGLLRLVGRLLRLN
jgi:hypothetical protein